MVERLEIARVDDAVVRRWSRLGYADVLLRIETPGGGGFGAA